MTCSIVNARGIAEGFLQIPSQLNTHHGIILLNNLLDKGRTFLAINERPWKLQHTTFHSKCDRLCFQIETAAPTGEFHQSNDWEFATSPATGRRPTHSYPYLNATGERATTSVRLVLITESPHFLTNSFKSSRAYTITTNISTSTGHFWKLMKSSPLKIARLILPNS